MLRDRATAGGSTLNSLNPHFNNITKSIPSVDKGDGNNFTSNSAPMGNNKFGSTLSIDNMSSPVSKPNALDLNNIALQRNSLQQQSILTSRNLSNLAMTSDSSNQNSLALMKAFKDNNLMSANITSDSASSNNSLHLVQGPGINPMNMLNPNIIITPRIAAPLTSTFLIMSKKFFS